MESISEFSTIEVGIRVKMLAGIIDCHYVFLYVEAITPVNFLVLVNEFCFPKTFRDVVIMVTMTTYWHFTAPSAV
jgi:hypothetical protein